MKNQKFKAGTFALPECFQLKGDVEMLYIGVDLGTSAVKLLMMDESGDIKKVVSREYPLFFPQPGWSEQHPEDWFTQAMDGLKAVTAECDKSQVAGISFGGQMHGLVALDADDQVIRPAILWNDGRTGEERISCLITRPTLLLLVLQRQRFCGCESMSRRILRRL